MECLATSNSIFSGSTQSALDNSESKILNERLNPSSSSSNWVSADVALRMLSHAKYSFAMQYISNMLTEHPSWPENIQTEAIQYNTQLSNFGKKLNTGLAYFEQKYSLNRHHLINMVFLFYFIVSILLCLFLTLIFLYCSDYRLFIQPGPHVYCL